MFCTMCQIVLQQSKCVKGSNRSQVCHELSPSLLLVTGVNFYKLNILQAECVCACACVRDGLTQARGIFVAKTFIMPVKGTPPFT